MLERHVLIRLEDGEGRHVRRRELMDKLGALLQEIPTVSKHRLGEASDAVSLGSWDIVAVICFEDEASLAEFGVHPLHSEFVRAEFAEGVACVKAWNFRMKQDARS